MTDLLAQATLTGRAVLAAGEALAGQRRGLGSLLPFAGPAVMASVAYMDPGNFATNIQAGAKYNYNLLWVVLVAVAAPRHHGFMCERVSHDGCSWGSGRRRARPPILCWSCKPLVFLCPPWPQPADACRLVEIYPD